VLHQEPVDAVRPVDRVQHGEDRDPAQGDVAPTRAVHPPGHESGIRLWFASRLGVSTTSTKSQTPLPLQSGPEARSRRSSAAGDPRTAEEGTSDAICTYRISNGAPTTSPVGT